MAGASIQALRVKLQAAEDAIGVWAGVSDHRPELQNLRGNTPNPPPHQLIVLHPGVDACGQSGVARTPALDGSERVCDLVMRG